MFKFLLFLLITSHLLLITNHGALSKNYEKSKAVKVSASIEDNRVTIFGYTSPGSRVELSNPFVFAVAYSDDSGYFNFDRTLLPKVQMSELCLVALDDNSRRTTPVCFPSPPAVNYHTDIGPVILPPTLSLDADSIDPHSTSVASGQGIPDTEVTVYLFQTDSRPSLIPEAQAFSLPQYTVRADSRGNYSFSLPTIYSTSYRLYSTLTYNDSPSPKSNTLFFSLPGFQINYFFIFFLFLFLLLITSYLLLFLRRRRRYLPAIFSYPLQLMYVRKN